jgi:hypothetical protein
MIKSKLQSVKRVMDITQDFLASINVRPPSKYVVSGVSKRGWVAWLSTAVDSNRIIGSMPIVYDFLKFNEVTNQLLINIIVQGNFNFCCCVHFSFFFVTQEFTKSFYEFGGCVRFCHQRLYTSKC